MNAEIICVGTEIILGDILNTHSQFLSQELAALGLNVYYQTAVGDNDRRFTQILKTALERSDVVFLTGGLGPTILLKKWPVSFWEYLVYMTNRWERRSRNIFSVPVVR